MVRKYHDPQIKDRIHMWENGLKTEQVDFLDVLLMLTIAEIQVLIMDLMIATIDNPSNAIEWALAEMINKPEMLVRAREELDIIVGKERLVKEFDLPKLNYIKACIREAFRLHPVAPFNVPHASIEHTTVGDGMPRSSYGLYHDYLDDG
ncbi:hypothetical protein M9H77_27950 [Catharanthus roseus]|uniref:Uncharacterized protein n=1 Tax=Catharanthus roseus TaxID=4058 RepID=A0ACC0ADY2_CATRO|nr:hypothetical protein M9H77_27950 [Catharanthus roseus]